MANRFYFQFILSTSITALLFFYSTPARAQNKSGLKTRTEVSVETRGGKEVEIKRHYEAFDQRGNLTEEVDYDPDGKFKEETKYEYSADNQKVKEIHYMTEGKVDEIISYTYDAKGNKTSRVSTDGSGKLKSMKKYKNEYY